LKTSNKHH
jgi:serine/threonine protein phosphatase PrpC